MKKMKLVLIGNGMAGVRTLEELLKIAPDLYDITVFGAEPHPNYNRILLSPVLAGEQTLDEIVLNPLSWYAEHGITLHLGKAVTTIDRVKRKVIAADGTEADYDRLLIATGSLPFMLPVPGKDLQGVIAYRDIADTTTMIETARTHTHAVVIGGGLLGLEAANGLMRRGMQVTVVHLAPWLMERQLDDVAGGLLAQSLRERGLSFELGAHTAELLGNEAGRVRAVKFKDGREIPADLVVMAAGIRPNTALAEAAGLLVNRGIVVSDTLQTVTDPRIWAVGECAAHRGIAYGLVAPLFEQGKVCATHLAEFGIGRYTGSQTSTKLKVTGIDLFSAGDFMGGEGTEEIVLSDPNGGVYKKLVLKDDKLVGACLYGDTVDGSWYFKLLREGRTVDDIRDKLMFGQHFTTSNIGDVGHQGHNKAAAMADTDEVCGCNGVSKGAICKAIQDKGLFTLDEVRKHTKASASCGSCTGLVEQLIMATAGGDYSATPRLKPMCGCTELGHQAVRDAIFAQHLTFHARGARRAGLEDARRLRQLPPGAQLLPDQLLAQGGAGRPAEPLHQRARPRQYPEGRDLQRHSPHVGGETTADELRRIADAVDKYQIPTVKVTGGQRIDLLGVKKEDLVNVWKDIGMPSGHAYAKALRTVKTCVGSEWCRMGTQDSTQMGKDMERAMWRMYAPHKVKFAVSGCPRNCAEAGIKDVGIIGVDSGWEMYVAGNGGIKTEVAQFFTKLKTADEVLEYTGAFMQLYRKEGWYLERTVHYVNRVGMDHLKARILDDAEGRKALWAELQFALDGEPDPWFDFEKARVDTRQFIPIAVAAPVLESAT